MDNHHVHVTSSSMSCGVLELSDIKSDSLKVLYALASYLYHPSRGQPAAFVAWSDLPESNGGLLFKQIESTFGGRELQSSSLEENPKTGNKIQVFLWVIPHEKFKMWYKEFKISKIKQELS